MTPTRMPETYSLSVWVRLVVIEAALWGLVGGLALVVGAVIALELKPGRHVVAYVMAFGSGVLISAVAYDLTAEAFTLGGGDAVGIGLAAGALVYAGLAFRIKGPPPTPALGRETDGGRWIALGALLDGIPESAAIGLTLVEGDGVGVAFIVAVFISNLPEPSPPPSSRPAGRSRLDPAPVARDSCRLIGLGGGRLRAARRRLRHCRPWSTPLPAARS